MLFRQMPVHPCDVAGTCGCDSSVVDTGPGQSRVLGWALAHVVDAVCRSDSFTGSLHTLHWSGGDDDGGNRVDVAVVLHCCCLWAWMRMCRSSMQLLRGAASPHCPGVSSVGCGCPCRDVACSSVIRLMLLGSTGVSLRARRGVTRLLVSGRGCGCVRLLCSCRG